MTSDSYSHPVFGRYAPDTLCECGHPQKSHNKMGLSENLIVGTNCMACSMCREFRLKKNDERSESRSPDGDGQQAGNAEVRGQQTPSAKPPSGGDGTSQPRQKEGNAGEPDSAAGSEPADSLSIIAPAAVAAPQSEQDAIWVEARKIAEDREQSFRRRRTQRREDRINVLAHDILAIVQRHLAAARLTVQQLTAKLADKELRVKRFAQLEQDWKDSQAALDAERALRQQLADERDNRVRDLSELEYLYEGGPYHNRDLIERVFDRCLAAREELHQRHMAAARGSASPDPKDA